ncbi:hypothetical protein A3A95_00905 [Candidatus Nomurabacteria bacterium RIFCSPLOWO2_01_FULL_39_18]|uniref:Uncharacterized protein n=1 Tax=Candidatus Nomurabacteria bacterium RIFCSPHIGHO2_01_FULL_40_24b TaxID=1801739 RepID=A0A1F6V6Z8_9BACT|nr:MAG: hypothetical protein A2647_02705 [Candidatus Nomurabacteria bacterium RIFCSPHIGHO2_01_FULL_40_24b]OGI89867.1 MAG: hypothetical protein A3A95_00905 [Candidatus Nomurabacteria bacterium RIFCSPLOWO2_01_FULL_39_18]
MESPPKIIPSLLKNSVAESGAVPEPAPEQPAEIASEQATATTRDMVNAKEAQKVAKTSRATEEDVERLRQKITRIFEGRKNYTEKIHEILQKHDVATPFNTLRIILNSRVEQGFNPIVNPDAISALSTAVEGLEKIIRQSEITIEDVKTEFSRHSALLRSLFENIPRINVINDNTESLLSVGQAFAGIHKMNEDLIREFSGADESAEKKESAELNAVLHETNNYLDRAVRYINEKLSVLEDYSR